MPEIAMEQIYAIAGFLIVAVITPGPNNLVVLTAAKRGGLMAAMPPMLGVIGGSLALLTMVWVGARVAFDLIPSLHLILAFVGAGYIGGLGATMIWRASRCNGADSSHKVAGLPTTMLGLAIFQFLNPKAWVLMATATAVASGHPFGFIVLAALLIVICGVCLTLWAFFGSMIARYLGGERSNRWFDYTMGLMLIGSAALLLFAT
jgi:threonine/homoserine/homoserine lactone efflux protein